MRPVHLIPVRDARENAVARDVPTYEPGPCDGCPYTHVCAGRGAHTVFLVREVRGKPVYCKKIGDRMVACRADALPALEPGAGQGVRGAVATYLCDSNVFINAHRWGWKQCQAVLQHAGAHYEIATTRPVWAELRYAYELPADLRFIDVDVARIDPRILELARANVGALPADEASLADLSLVQALLDHPGLAGIISEDDDLVRLHVPSAVKALSGRDVTFMTCAQLVRSRPSWFRASATG